ncbi:replicative DNA helicase [Citrifermentans bemidjiense Bem]|uniref:DNA 5'-3' helicase n=1 Tax=Citrifermentans bemidjiense (strain ATCC BAA-1014 / DSM 16622 / JCM 12645 / Bem) TaxID=404380 RepID=B5EC29_CITBB|nr:DnaB-like helicase N-terminal domain-containing protein [Citrifermentans bemidjiense]ACH40485.1 replicative DNA helicase [Citrifermentans bemidjiense Bem]
MQREPPPQNIEAEMSVLGAVLIDNPCLKQVRGILDGADFYRESHRLIFHAFLSLQLADSPFDLVTLTKHLRDAGTLEQIGGGAYLAILVDYVPMSANVVHYCKMVKEAATRRQIIAYAQSLITIAHDGCSVAEGLQEAKAGLASIASSMDTYGGVSIADIADMDSRAARYEKQIKTIQQSRFVTGFSRLDSLIRGVAPGEVMTIIAYAGSFKTAFLQNLLLAGAKRTHFFHLFFSLEMPVEKVFEREVQISTGMTGRAVEDTFNVDGGQAMAGTVGAGMVSGGSMGLLVCDKPRLNLEKIARLTELAGQKYGKINAIGIDYMGLLDAPGKTLFDRTAYISAGVKNMAKELGVPVVLLCQINREAAKVEYDIAAHSAKGGGDIEAGADFMLGFYTDEAGDLICKGLKNRNGPKDWRLKVVIDKPSFQFQDMVSYTKPKEEKPKRRTAV